VEDVDGLGVLPGSVTVRGGVDDSMRGDDGRPVGVDDPLHFGSGNVGALMCTGPIGDTPGDSVAHAPRTSSVRTSTCPELHDAGAAENQNYVLIRLELDAEPPLLDLLAYLVDVPGQVEEFIDVVLLFVPGSKITIEVGRLGCVASFDTPVDRALQVAPLSGNLLIEMPVGIRARLRHSSSQPWAAPWNNFANASGG